MAGAGCDQLSGLLIGLSRSIEVGHGEGGRGAAVDAFFKASCSSAGVARVPEVTDEEEEGQHELGGGQPLADVDEVDRVGQAEFR